MAKLSRFQQALDKWVIDADCSTVVLEEAASYLARSLDDNPITSAQAGGTYLGICFAVAALAGVPLSVVEETVRRMAGMEDDDE